VVQNPERISPLEAAFPPVNTPISDTLGGITQAAAKLLLDTAVPDIIFCVTA
jgi:hypothetical protein